MVDIVSRAQLFERSDLATFLKSPRLQKQMENVILDVVETLPTGLDQVSADVAVAQATANTAIINAATAQATANTALSNAATAQATVNALAQRDVPLPLVDAATILVDASAHNSFSVTLGGNRTLDAPSNLADGMLLNFAIRQDATGSRTLAFDAIYDFGEAGAPILSTAASVVDYVMGYYDSTSNKILASFRKGGVVTSASFSAHNNGTAQAIPSGAFTILNMSTEDYDVGSHFASNAWTPPARLVSIVGAVALNTAAVLANYTVSVFKNGAEFKRGTMHLSNLGGGAVVATVACQDAANGTDVYDLRASQTTGAPQNTTGAATVTYFQGTTLST